MTSLSLTTLQDIKLVRCMTELSYIKSAGSFNEDELIEMETLLRQM